MSPARTVHLTLLRCSMALVLLGLFMLAAANARATPAATALESQVKAAYLYKFAGYVEWPEASFARPDAPLLIAVAGNEALAAQLERIVSGRSVNGHPVQVRRVQGVDELAGAHILFLDGGLDRALAAALLAGARGHSLLTVSDGSDALAHGVMIGFVVANDRLRFDIALRQVAPSKLKISARMLAVAHRVEGAT